MRVVDILKIVGVDKPFVVTFGNKPDEYAYMFTNEGDMVYNGARSNLDLNLCSVNYMHLNSGTAWPGVVIVDYFGEKSGSESKACSCDLWTVLMVSGCKCGGR